MPSSMPADEAAIREQAYYFWEAEGRPVGRETEFWMRATVAVTEKQQLDTLVAAPKKKTKAEAGATAAASAAKASPSKAEKPAGKPKAKKS